MNEQKSFVVRKSDIVGRIDPQYYTDIQNLGEYVPLGKYVILKGGKRIPKGDGYSFNDTPYKYYRVADMDLESEFCVCNLKSIDKSIYELLSRYTVAEGQVIFSIAGTIGKSVMVKNIPSGIHVVLTENCVVISPKRSTEMLPDYLKIILELSVVRKQIALSITQTTIPKLGIERIKMLLVPPIPGIEIQQSVVDIKNDAYKKKRKKVKCAQELYNGIDKYLIDKLGILFNNINNDLSSRIFVFDKKNLSDRFDPEYTRVAKCRPYSNVFDNVALIEVAHIKKGTAMTSDNAIPGSIPIIAGGKTPAGSHNVGNFGGNVITVSASGAYSGYVWYHDNPIFATDCNVVFSKDESRFLTKYLYEVLRLQQEYIYQLQTGAAQPHIYASNIRGLKIPNIPIVKQIEIVDRISETRLLAKSLIDEGEKILNEANMEVERMILGDV